jgi:hypothetical protein
MEAEKSMNGAGKITMQSTKGLNSCAYFCSFLVAVSSALPSEEVSSLKDLYYSTGGAGWRNSEGWVVAPEVACSWFGVSCNADESHVMYAPFYV